MNPHQIKIFLLVAIGLYVFVLVFFLFGYETKNNGSNDDTKFLPMDNPQNIQKLYKDIFGLKTMRNGTGTYLKRGRIPIFNTKRATHQKNKKIKEPNGNKSKKHGKRRKLTNDSIEKLKQNRSRRDSVHAVNNREYWESLKNLTFKEKVDVVFGKYKIKQNFTVKRPKYFKVNKNVTNKNNAKQETSEKNYGNSSEQNFPNRKGEIKINSTLTTSNAAFLEVSENVFVFSSFFDDRQETHFIRNIMIARSGNRNEKIWCHFKNQFSEKWQPSILKFYETCENHLKTFAAYVGSCEIPINTEYHHIYIANTQTLNIDEMKPIKVLQHTQNKSPSGLAACVPPLFGNLNAVQILEFIEFSILLGYKHFTFYSQDISKHILKILDHFRKQGLVSVIQWPLTLGDDDIWYHGQSAAVWDCLYRNMYVFKHVAFLDIDEFIFPRKTETLTDFLQVEYENKPYSSDVCAYRFQSAYFEPLKNQTNLDIFEVSGNVEKYLVSMKSLSRKDTFSNIRTKMIVDPIKIFELGIHHVSKPMQENFRVENIDPNEAVIHHYQKCKSNYGNRCYGKVYDDHALRFRNRLLTKLKWRFFYLLNDLFKSK